MVFEPSSLLAKIYQLDQKMCQFVAKMIVKAF